MSKDELSEARKILQQAVQAADATRDPDPFWRAEILRDIGLAQAKAADFTNARTTLSNAMQAASGIIDESLRMATRARIATVQARAGDRSSAESYLRELLPLPSRESVLRNQSTVINASTVQAALGDNRAALGTIRSMKDPPWENVALYSIVETQLEAGAVREALGTVSQMQNDGVKVDALVAIAVRQVKLAGDANGHDTFRVALQTATELTDHSVKVLKLLNIASIQGISGDRVGALRTIQRALEGGGALQSNNARLELAVAYANSGEFEKAREIIATIGTDNAKNIALSWLAVAEARSKNVTAALETTANIKDGPWKDNAYEGIAVAQAKNGFFEPALEVAAAVKRDPGTPLRGIGRAQAKAGDIKGALKWALKQNSPFLKASALLGVTEGILERFESKKAKNKKVTARLN